MELGPASLSKWRIQLAKPDVWKWTVERIQRLHQYATAGLTDTHAAKKLGCETRTLQRRAKVLRLHFPATGGGFWTPQRNVLLKKLLAEGHSRAYIAKELKASRRFLADHVEKSQAALRLDRYKYNLVVIAAKGYPNASLRELSEALAVEPFFIHAVLRRAQIQRDVHCECSYNCGKVSTMRDFIMDFNEQQISLG